MNMQLFNHIDRHFTTCKQTQDENHCLTHPSWWDNTQDMSLIDDNQIKNYMDKSEKFMEMCEAIKINIYDYKNEWLDGEAKNNGLIQVPFKRRCPNINTSKYY